MKTTTETASIDGNDLLKMIPIDAVVRDATRLTMPISAVDP